jgi:hypothetical protein
VASTPERGPFQAPSRRIRAGSSTGAGMTITVDRADLASARLTSMPSDLCR